MTITSVVNPLGPQNFQEVAMFRIQDGRGMFVFDKNRDYTWNEGDKASLFGGPGDIPVAGDWFGTGTINIGVFHCAVGADICQWMIDANNNGTWDGVDGCDVLWNFGMPGDFPIVGDWTGDAVSKIGVMRCRSSPCLWLLDVNRRHVLDDSVRLAHFGEAGDIPVVNNWSGRGNADQIGIFRGGQWIVDINNNGIMDSGDATYQYGAPGDFPIVGNWFGASKRRIGVFRQASLNGFYSNVLILNVGGNNFEVE